MFGIAFTSIVCLCQSLAGPSVFPGIIVVWLVLYEHCCPCLIDWPAHIKRGIIVPICRGHLHCARPASSSHSPSGERDSREIRPMNRWWHPRKWNRAVGTKLHCCPPVTRLNVQIALARNKRGHLKHLSNKSAYSYVWLEH